mmetsp:Transcript_8648/g.16338  ORF Transcript_8648/g.16338 Transcript_8648/m.16338 type:complete len:118 (+) Transcript_8648:204-557(+)
MAGTTGTPKVINTQRIRCRIIRALLVLFLSCSNEMIQAFAPAIEPNRSYSSLFNKRSSQKCPRAIGCPTIAFSTFRRLLLSKQSQLFTTLYDDFEDFESSSEAKSSSSASASASASE